MAFHMANVVLNNFSKFCRIHASAGTVVLSNGNLQPLLIQSRGLPTQKHQKILAANQKRNRIRRLEKQNEVKLDFVARQQVEKLKNANFKSRRYDPSKLQDTPTTPVYHQKYFKLKEISPEEAIQMHRETHDVTILNDPNGLLTARVELDMTAKKKGKFQAPFEGTVIFPHNFEHTGRIMKILVFCKNAEEEKEAMSRGADLAGGVALIKKIEQGDLDVHQFDHILSASEMLPELNALRNVLKKKMPSAKSGTVSENAGDIAEAFRRSVTYEAKNDAYEPDFADLVVPIGRLNMPMEKLINNFRTLLEEVDSHRVRGRGEGTFIVDVYLECPPSTEKFMINKSLLLPAYAKKEARQEETAEDDEEETVAASAN